jgi:hypothetical protein
MSDDFDPPITLICNIVVFTLDDAAAFVRSYKDAGLQSSQGAVLRLLESAATAEERALAAAAFRTWARKACSGLSFADADAAMQRERGPLPAVFTAWPNSNSIRHSN